MDAEEVRHSATETNTIIAYQDEDKVKKEVFSNSHTNYLVFLVIHNRFL